MKTDADYAKKPRVCFVCPYCYPLFDSQYRTMFGGWEVRISLLAKEIAKRGNFEVSLIVADAGQSHRENREGVELITWRGKAFYGIWKGKLENENQEEVFNLAENTRDETVSQIRSPKRAGKSNLQARIKTFYKKIMPWRIRTLVHGLLDSLVLGLQTTRQHAGVTLNIATRAIGHISEIPVFPEMVAIFEEVDADIYVVPGNNHISALVACFCKKKKRTYIMLAGSDKDFTHEILDNPTGVNIYGDSNVYLLYSIQNAARHIAQNKHQIELAGRFGVSPVLIPSPIDLERIYPKEPNPHMILWVGNSNERVKQPSVMLDVIRQMPDFQFTMIVTPISQEDYTNLQEAARLLSNLTILSRIPFDEVEQFYAQAKLLVNTSKIEGFPNTFLQAGKYGVPVVSLQVDPNDMLSKDRCGLLCGGDERQLLNGIVKLMTDETVYNQLSSNILNYVRENHDKNRIIPLLEAAFRCVPG